MKRRVDFVTNSSSSSFICEICGYEDGGFDVGLSDVGMVECENGHIFCENEMIEFTKEEWVQFMKEKFNEDFNDDKKTVESIQREYLREFDGRYELAQELCPICKMEVLTDNDFISYTTKKYNISSTELLKEIKEQFGTYDEFKKWLKEK